jgi:hypothetical protein
MTVMHNGVVTIIRNTAAPGKSSASRTTYFYNRVFLATSHHLAMSRFLGSYTTPFINRRLCLPVLLISWSCESMTFLGISWLPSLIGALPFANLLL